VAAGLDATVTRFVTVYLPPRACPCYGKVNVTQPPPLAPIPAA
jgi:hypothetical protein